MALASEKATDKRPPYPGASKAKTPWRIGVATACPQAATQHTPARSSPVRSTRTRCVKTSCFRQDGLPSHLANYPKVAVVEALKADQAAAAVENAMAKAAGAVEEPDHPSSTPFAKVTPQAANKFTPQAANKVTHPAATLPADIQATPVSITALIATINAAVTRFVSRYFAVAQATGTASTVKTAVITATTAAPTKTTGATAAAVTRCMPTGATAAAAAARRWSTKATPNRPPPPSAAKAAARRAALPVR
ncbi:hypothetical protein AaE_006238 [Aphanomyces astaci]|uniref:Uncharacterized protein n=1 Tax=Aphanomyces astaci TaxID=112090 RepID=A0A6A5ALP0_APHAT|nr:hypothetical protein AaE_006238 [Aphanomyces astaci]